MDNYKKADPGDVIIFDNVSKFYSLDIKITKRRTLHSIFFGKKRGWEEDERVRYVLRNLTFSVKEGEKLLVLGPSESGKSTIAKLICGLAYPTEGKVTVKGKVRYVTSTPVASNPLMTLNEYSHLLAMVCGADARHLSELCNGILNDCELTDMKDTKIYDLPGRILKELVYYTMLYIDADIYIFDNTLRLDRSRFGDLCWNKIEKILKERTVVILKKDIQHLDERVIKYLDKVLIIEEGKTVSFGPYAKIFGLNYRTNMNEKKEDIGKQPSYSVYHNGNISDRDEQQRQTSYPVYLVINRILREYKKTNSKTGEQAPSLEELLHVNLRKELEEILDTSKTIVLGPYISDVGVEFTYWIPFLRWLIHTYKLDSRRIIAISRCGARLWYEDLGVEYLDISDLMDDSELAEYFRTITTGWNMKQFYLTVGEKEILKRAAQKAKIHDYSLIHPALMWNLFLPVWKRFLPLDFIYNYTAYEPFNHLCWNKKDTFGLPENYIVVKFSFFPYFPQTRENLSFLDELIRILARNFNVVSLHTDILVDRHKEFNYDANGLYEIRDKVNYKNILEIQTKIMSNAALCLGVLGNIISFAPYLNVKTLSIYSNREAGTLPVTLTLYESYISRFFKSTYSALDISKMGVSDVVDVIEKCYIAD